jgi:hypothetical protein
VIGTALDGKTGGTMTKAFFRIASMLALALVASAQLVRAQEPVLANIPFAFTAGSMALPAGEYRVEKMAIDSSMLLIRSTDGSAAKIVASNAAQANGPQVQSKLVFHRYGNRYFLSQVWVAGNSQGRELPKSAKEKEQALAAHNEKPDQVTVIARLIPPQP